MTSIEWTDATWNPLAGCSITSPGCAHCYAMKLAHRLAPLGTDKWDYEDRRRVVVQRNGVNRTRPAMKAGWRAEFDLMVNLPEYITPQLLNEVIASAGRLIGLGDFRPTYGRFNVTSFSVRP